MVEDGTNDEAMEDASMDYSTLDGELGYGSKFFKSFYHTFIKDLKVAQVITIVPHAPPSQNQSAFKGNQRMLGNPKPLDIVGRKWRDLFSSNQNSIECPKLFHCSRTSKAQSCTFLDEDLDSNCDL
ncbi:hypothetical protein OIU77_005118 [Salix suchowensis]|uniref:Uncharacterized protein n=1 Tax=Salix suchowensis TaxID=1278906 RepID=A0ABQ9AN92_9ROSI|nr:hypothetical protein OIU77_005118 [Salix suchowensis]